MPAERVQSSSPWHIVLILDDSGSMVGDPAKYVNESVESMIDEMKILSSGVKPYFKLSIIKFGSRAEILTEFTNEQQVNIQKVTTMSGQSGSTNATAALDSALQILNKNPGNTTDFTPYIFFLSDGHPDETQTALEVGNKIKSLQIAAGTPQIVTIGFGAVNDQFMENLATKSELYKKLQQPRDIISFFPNIGTVAQSSAKKGVEGVNQTIIDL